MILFQSLNSGFINRMKMVNVTIQFLKRQDSTHNKLWHGSFSAAGPRLWNDLSPRLWRPGLIFDPFRQSLKSHVLKSIDIEENGCCFWNLVYLTPEALSDHWIYWCYTNNRIMTQRITDPTSWDSIHNDLDLFWAIFRCTILWITGLSQITVNNIVILQFWHQWRWPGDLAICSPATVFILWQ